MGDTVEIKTENTSSEQADAQKTQEFSVNDFEALYNYALAQRYKNSLKVTKASNYFGGRDFNKDSIYKWLRQPVLYEKQLRNASRYMYEVSGQYRRLCNYQPNMIKFSYILEPANDQVFAKDFDEEAYTAAYRDTALKLDGMNLATLGNRLFRVCGREGIVFAYAKQDGNNTNFYILDADYCRIYGIDVFGCIRFEFNYRYFSLFKESDRDALLSALGSEFQDGYVQYCSDLKPWRQIGIDGIVIKWDPDILNYSTPPYVSTIDSLFDIEDYKQLTKAKEEAGNYNLLGFTVPTNKDGKILMDLGLAKKFIDQASSELPSTIGVLMSPMEMEKFNFSKPSATADQNAVADSEEQFWATSGTSELLFGTSKSSANALAKSIIADEINVFPLLRQFELWLNRRLSTKAKYKFKVKFLEVTAFNQTDMFDTLLKAGNSGLPVKSALASVLGFTPHEMLTMAELENNILKVRDTMYNKPLYSSSTMSSSEAGGEGGRPEVDADDLSPEGEKTRETEGNIRE